MQGALGVAAMSAIAYVGVMTPDIGDLGVQLSATEPARRRRNALAHLLGIGSLLGVAAAVASVLSAVPTWCVLILSLAPIALAVRRAKEPRAEAPRSRRSPTTYTATIVHGGGALAVWIALLRLAWSWRDVVVVLVTLALEGLAVLLATWAAQSPTRADRLRNVAHRLSPFTFSVAALVVITGVAIS